MSDPATRRKSIRFCGRSYIAFVLTPEPPIFEWLANLDEWASQFAGYFIGKPVVLTFGILEERIGSARAKIQIREAIEMAFFKRKLNSVERFESALKDKQAAREMLAYRLSGAEATLGERRAAAERLAVAGAADAQLDRAEASIRAAEDRVKTLSTALTQVNEQIGETVRELTAAKAQRDRDMVADELEAMATAIAQVTPNYDAAAVALIQAVTKSPVSTLEATRLGTHLDAVRRDVDSAAALICSELRTAAVRTRAGNANIAFRAPHEPKAPPSEVERQLIYTLNPLLWRENGEVRRVPAFAQVRLPKTLLLVALLHEHVDYLSASRVQSLMQVHGSGQSYCALFHDDPRLVDLDALAAQTKESAKPDAA